MTSNSAARQQRQQQSADPPPSDQAPSFQSCCREQSRQRAHARRARCLPSGSSAAPRASAPDHRRSPPTCLHSHSPSCFFADLHQVLHFCFLRKFAQVALLKTTSAGTRTLHNAQSPVQKRAKRSCTGLSARSSGTAGTSHIRWSYDLTKPARRTCPASSMCSAG